MLLMYNIVVRIDIDRVYSKAHLTVAKIHIEYNVIPIIEISNGIVC